MVIGMDASSLSSTPRGIGKVTAEVLRNLITFDNVQIVALWPSAIGWDSPSPNLRFVTLPYDGTVAESDRHACWVQQSLPAYLASHHIDLFWGPSYDVPLNWQGPKVSFVHDLIFELGPSFHPDDETHDRQWARLCAQAADAVVTNSEHTRRQIIYYWQLSPSKVYAVDLAPAIRFIPCSQEESRAVINSHFHVPGPYFLHVGGFRARKNIYTALKAFSMLTQRTHSNMTFVALGTANSFAKIIIKGLRIEDQLRIIPYCPEHLMPHLYAGAEALIYPSSVEGFGLPPLEAMACGTAVITSKAGAIPEVVGLNNALFVDDPNDAGGLSRLMVRIIDSKPLRTELIRRGQVWHRSFTWNRTAKGILTVFERVLSL